jgi:queuine/archaeosine tRNA-ribosyltransferase
MAQMREAIASSSFEAFRARFARERAQGTD